jgi:hypothetical protein
MKFEDNTSIRNDRSSTTDGGSIANTNGMVEQLEARP